MSSDSVAQDAAAENDAWANVTEANKSHFQALKEWRWCVLDLSCLVLHGNLRVFCLTIVFHLVCYFVLLSQKCVCSLFDCVVVFAMTLNADFLITKSPQWWWRCCRLATSFHFACCCLVLSIRVGRWLGDLCVVGCLLCHVGDAQRDQWTTFVDIFCSSIVQ